MPRFLKLRRLLPGLVLALLASGALAIPAAAFSVPWPSFPTPVSPNAQRINNLYDLISIFAGIVFVFVEGWILFVIIRYRRGAHPPGYVPPQWHGNRMLELIWTLIPLALVLFIAFLSFQELQRDFTKRTDAETQLAIQVTGVQFQWNYKYPQGFTTSKTLVVPVGELVRLQVGSTDVIHSWWVPALGGKTDAVPGYYNYTWFKIDRAGSYNGQCAELCGPGHYTMTTTVKAMSVAGYNQWVSQQMAALHKSKHSSSGSSSSTTSSGQTSSSSSTATSSTSAAGSSS